MEWRQQHRVNSLLETEFKAVDKYEVMEKYFPCGIIGQDKFGHPRK